MLGPSKETKRKIVVSSGTIYVRRHNMNVLQTRTGTMLLKTDSIKMLLTDVSNGIRHIQNTNSSSKICKL
jgi:hypothetical protein